MIEAPRFATKYYHKLVNEGGRPLYPIDIIQDVYRYPDNYADMLRPWRESLDEDHKIDPECIFQRQLQRWQDFRKWQNNNRGREDDDGGFLEYVQGYKDMIEETCLPDGAAETLAEIEADPSCLKSEWDHEQLLREQNRRRYREHGCNGFRDYAEAVKRRLARHGFAQPFELDEDPKKQDRLTAWIEYLNFEYWWLDQYTQVLLNSGSQIMTRRGKSSSTRIYLDLTRPKSLCRLPRHWWSAKPSSITFAGPCEGQGQRQDESMR